MISCNYIVKQICGEYAYLLMLNEDNIPKNEEEKMVALALLPVDIKEGSILHYEFIEYSLVK